MIRHFCNNSQQMTDFIGKHMNSTQKIHIRRSLGVVGFIVFTAITFFSNVDAMFSWDKKPSKKVSFNEQTIEMPNFQYDCEEDNPTQWQTENENLIARYERRIEAKMTVEQMHNRDDRNRRFMHTRVESMKNATNYFSSPQCENEKNCSTPSMPNNIKSSKMKRREAKALQHKEKETDMPLLYASLAITFVIGAYYINYFRVNSPEDSSN